MSGPADATPAGSRRPGYALPLLLAQAFRGLVDALHAQLAEQGHPDARPLHGFALQAVGAEGATPSELGRRLGVSKQAATKTALALERLGYLQRETHPDDARAVLLRRTPRGVDLLERSAVIFARLRAELEADLGPARVAALEDDLERIGAASGARLGDLPGWLR